MSRFLIVDDEPDLRALFAEVLGFAGHQVIGTAADGNEAVFKFEAAYPNCDVVLMDYRMPLMSGADATEEIVHRHPDAKVIMLTADENVLHHAKEKGAVGAISKPFNIAVLLRSIDNVVTAEDAVEAARK